MAKASDNQFPSVLFTEQGSAPAGPAAGDQRIFIDSADHHLKRVDSGGNVTDLEGAGGVSGDMTWAVIQALQLVNEVKGYPAMVGIDVDLVAANQWWDSIGTPTTAATMVDVAGEAGITETWEYALKCVTDAGSEGFEQRFTYADEPRVKSGRKLSAIAAVWVGTEGSTVTMALTNSSSETTTATATAQAWTILKVENHLLAGSYVDLEFTVDGADTFYVVPLGVNIGEKAVPLRARGMRYRECLSTSTAENLSGASATQDWHDVDLTALTSTLAAQLHLYIFLDEDVSFWSYRARRNGDSRTGAELVRARVLASARDAHNDFSLLCDDGQVIETKLELVSGTNANNDCQLFCRGWWEWE